MAITGISGRQIEDVFNTSSLLTYKTYIKFNGISNPDKNLFLIDYPSFSFPSYNITRVGYPYKAGQDIYKDGGSTNLIITCSFGLLRPSSLAKFNDELRDIRKWLRIAKTSNNIYPGTPAGYEKGYLEIVDEGESRFFDVLDVTINEVERETQAFGKIEVSFECSPYEYIYSPLYKLEYTVTNNNTITIPLNNEWDDTRPVFDIKFCRTGTTSIIDVSGSSISGETNKLLFTIKKGNTTVAEMKTPDNYTSRLFITTDSMIVLSKSNIYTTVNNRTGYFDGAFDDLWLPGNTITNLKITPQLSTAADMVITVYPRWRVGYGT